MPKYAPVGKNNDLLPFAKELRKNMTPQERKLWYLFLRKYPVKIYKQRIIDSYIVDFYCASARVAIEVDGSQHYTEEGLEHDHHRSAVIKTHHIKVIRFTNAQVDNSFGFVCSTIDRVIKEQIEVRRIAESEPGETDYIEYDDE